MTTRMIWLGLAAACMAALVGRTVTATSPASTEEERDSDRARTFLVMRITEDLDLEDAKALEVAKAIRAVDAKRLGLRSHRQEIESKIEALLRSKPNDAATLETLINQANEVDHDLALVGEEMSAAVQKILSIEERARLVLLKPRLQREIRQRVAATDQRGAAEEKH